MAEPTVTVAAVQLCATEDVDRNLAECRRWVAEAASRGARLVALPECYAFLGRDEAQKRAIAEVLDEASPGPILAATREWARDHRVWLIGGGMAERPAGDAAGDKVYNTLVVFAPDGRLAAAYRKIHLFDVDIPGGATLRESDSTLAGDEVVTVATPLGVLGLSICYDLRFPELYRRLVDQGAEILAIPSAFTAFTGAAHWHVLVRARAIENQAFVVAPAQVGRHNDRRESYGHSLIVDPWGGVLAECDGAHPGIAVAEIDLDVLRTRRAQMPCLEHRRF
ncbi:MAG: carbon-nitrogen hydrolase family protein [Deltaproteobacteria bacterium]|nr:MAG: carbon-nitrogen hydrolase family protein [Deltaproteobacteria bacterium]